MELITLQRIYEKKRTSFVIDVSQVMRQFPQKHRALLSKYSVFSVSDKKHEEAMKRWARGYHVAPGPFE
jgi:hypothetical protein